MAPGAGPLSDSRQGRTSVGRGAPRVVADRDGMERTLRREKTHRLAVRWRRLTDRVAGREERLAMRWDRFVDRVAGRRGRLAVRWDRLVVWIAGRWERLAVRWDGLVVWIAGRGERLAVRWDRLVDVTADRRQRVGGPRAEGNRHGLASHTGVLLAAPLLVALAVGVIALLPSGRETPARTDASSANRSPAAATSVATPAEAAAPASEDRSTGLTAYVNKDANYSFLHPNSWDVSTSSTAAVLTSPDSDVVVSFEGAPSGSLQQASDAVLKRFTDTVADARLLTTKAGKTLQGYRSLALGGTATDPTGAVSRFVVITVQGPDENRAMTLRFSADAEPLEASPAIVQIVSSFKMAPMG